MDRKQSNTSPDSGAFSCLFGANMYNLTPMTEATKAKKPASKAKKTAPKGEKFAVFAAGGKQYSVVPGQTLKIEKILSEHKEGDTIIFDNVLLIHNGGSEISLGAPFVDGAAVTATLTKIGRYKTVDVIKYKQKSRYFKKYGHRQPYFEVKIESIK